MQKTIRLFWLLTIIMIGGCKESLPQAPTPATELTTGIAVFEHANFQGRSALITSSISDLQDFDGPCEHDESTGTFAGRSVFYNWNDCISSVRVAPGWTATLFRDTDFDDDSLTLGEDHTNLQTTNHDCPKGGLNDCVSSIRVQRPAGLPPVGPLPRERAGPLEKGGGSMLEALLAVATR